MKQECSDCGVGFNCSSDQENKTCWCIAFPAIMPAEFEQNCRCPSCLAKAMADKIELAIQTQTLDEMLALARQYRGQTGLLEHVDYTIEAPDYVFSKWYHLKRGSCCGNGCRNCPY